MSFTDAEWQEIAGDMFAPSSPLGEHMNFAPPASPLLECADEEQQQEAKKEQATYVCRHCNQSAFVILRKAIARCAQCYQLVRCVPQCTACKKASCFVCWLAVDKPVLPSRQSCRACNIDCKVTSLPGHWRSMSHCRRMMVYEHPVRFCSRRCASGTPAQRTWVTAEEHARASKRPLTEPLRVGTCCVACGGAVLM